MTDFNEMSPPEEEESDERLKAVADSGNVEIDWLELQEILKSRLVDVLDIYLNRNSEHNEDNYQEPNVEKFNLEASKNEMTELITSFSEPPFTIQRICELLNKPLRYYDRVSTFIRGLEKNLRVTSSNNWPKGIDIRYDSVETNHDNDNRNDRNEQADNIDLNDHIDQDEQIENDDHIVQDDQIEQDYRIEQDDHIEQDVTIEQDDHIEQDDPIEQNDLTVQGEKARQIDQSDQDDQSEQNDQVVQREQIEQNSLTTDEDKPNLE